MTDPAAVKVAPLQNRIARLRRRLALERAVLLALVLLLALLLLRERRSTAAYLVSVNGRPVAVLGSQAELDQAISLAKATCGGSWSPEEIEFSPPLEFKRIRPEGKPFLSPRTAARAISRSVQMLAPGFGIEVDGRLQVALHTKEQAKQVLERVRSHYPYAGASARFLEKVKVVNTQVPADGSPSVEAAVLQLLGTAPPQRLYRVDTGDTAASIARHFHLTPQQLVSWNPGRDLAQVALGTRLAVSPPGGKPPVTVVTSREEYIYGAYPAPQEEIATGSLPPGRRKVVQAGRPGKAKYLLRLTYHNGQQCKQEKILQELLEPPTPTRILVGR